MKSDLQINSLASQTRRMWNEDAYSPIDIFAIVNGWREHKITIVKHPLSERISGMCTKEKEEIVIYINSTSSYGRQRFTLAHELYHVLYERIDKMIICAMDMSGERTDSEREADEFASYLLMPYDALVQFQTEQPNWNLGRIIDTEQFFQISHQAMLYRLAKEGFISGDDAERYKNLKISVEAAKRGYGTELYFPSPSNQRYFTTGEYVRKVEMLADRGLISNGMREEFLLDAHREDIVFGSDAEELSIYD